MVSEVSQKEKHKYHILTHTYNLEKQHDEPREMNLRTQQGKVQKGRTERRALMAYMLSCAEPAVGSCYTPCVEPSLLQMT